VVNLFTEDHAALTGARKVMITEQLKPEQSWNGTLNITRFVNLKKGFITIDASAFYTYFSNRILADFDTDPDKIIYSNLNGYAVSRGLSMAADANFTVPLKVNAGVTFMQVYRVNQIPTGYVQTLQLYSPPFTANYQISYTIARYNLTIDYTGQVYSPMRLPVLANDYRSDYSPWYSLQNVQFTKAVKQHFNVYLGVKNLLNFVPASPIMRPFDPFDKHVSENNPNQYTFDAAYAYAPLQGIRMFAGIRCCLD
jgi:outer membrane receptor for ferrienterochelin and colicins